jgi:hypothetical protein
MEIQNEKGLYFTGKRIVLVFQSFQEYFRNFSSARRADFIHHK